MTVFSLDQLPDIISKCGEYKDQSITFTPLSKVDLSSEHFTITSDMSITFPTNRFSCKKISISNCKVVIRNLTMCGSIKVDNGELEIFDSVIENPDPSIDYILAAQNNSTIIANNCTFSDSAHFGVSGDNHSFLAFDHCIFKNITLYGIEITFFSALKCTNTTFQDLQADSIVVADQCTAKISNCEFTGQQKRAIYVRNAEYFVFDNSIVRNCKLSAFFISNCEQFLMDTCHILNCGHTAIYLLQVLGVIKSTTISNCNGNGINASHSRVLIKKCAFHQTTFPSIAICESAFGSIQKCEISDSEMSGIIIRNDSQAAIEHTNIRNAKLFGIAISDSKEVSIKNSLIIQCQEAAVAVYNNSHIKIKSTNLIGPCKYGVDVFTAGSVNSQDTTIIGMSESAVWVHHAGYGLFQKLIVSTNQIPPDADIAQIVSEFDFNNVKENFDLQKVIKYESRRPFTIYNSFVVDYGFFEKNENLSAEDPPTGINSIGAKCKVCGGDTKNCSYTRCGHSVYCKQCWDAFEIKPTKCELCFMPIDNVAAPIELSHENEEGVCSICFSEPPDTMVLPCGHTVCYQCAKQWFLTSEVCPFCRQKNARAQLFVSYE